MENKRYLEQVEQRFPKCEALIKSLWPQSMYLRLKEAIDEKNVEDIKFWFDKIEYYLPDKLRLDITKVSDSVSSIIYIRNLDKSSYPNKPTRRCR